MIPGFVFDPTRNDFPDRMQAVYRTLRDEHPAYYNPDRGTWALSRYADVRQAASDSETFRSGGVKSSKGLMPMLQQMDAPRHGRLRNLLSRAFAPRRVAAMEPHIREIAVALIDRFHAKGQCDLLHDFAAQLPSQVIGRMIGIPDERIPVFLACTEAMLGLDPLAPKPGGLKPFGTIYQEFAKLLEERRRERRDDLMSALLDAEIDDQRLSEEELLGYCLLLVLGGNDTTMNLLANGAVLLARHPDQRKALIDDPSGIPLAIEEMLRYEAPTQSLPRVVSRDVEIHGQRIPAGEEVLLVWGAANHDDREFSEPQCFDIRREPNRHISFGYGTHFCMGANFARMEARIAFEELLARLPDYELAQLPRWQPSSWARTYQSVPIRFSSSGR